MPQIHANGIKLEYETFGDRNRPAILLIMGLAGQLIHWPDDFCAALAADGYHVIRYDNRDIGLSSKLDQLGKPQLLRAGIASLLRLPARAPYKLDDMARDAVGLLDALKIRSAHVIGVSMGGMIAQILAALYPQRVLSLVSIMSTSGNPRLPGPSLKIKLRMIRRPQKFDRESLVQHSMQTWRLIGSPAGYAPDDATLRAKVERSYDRNFHPQGLSRQTAAILASGSRVPLLPRIVAPTLIIHGAEDTLVPVAAAPELAKHIPGARLEIIPGMGHDLPAALIPRLVDLILPHLRRARSPRVSAAPSRQSSRA
jgi:pimeloyl-ACP methyl ester carboxylesterase